MLMSPESYVRELVDSDIQTQPAGIDLTVGTVEEFKEAGQMDFDDSTRKIAEAQPLGSRHLEGGKAYRVTYNEVIKVPEHAAGLVYPRSSLMRNGANLVSAVWEPGYEGRGQGLLQILNPHGIHLKKDARIGQILFLKLEKTAENSYQGRYQRENL
ncbi:MAG: deoxyuridine 5'-triphosphate nucleotidohydrolase [Candidatus Bipolaricaulota bacterium]